MTSEIVTLVLTSSLISAIFGGFIAGAFTLLTVRNNYANDYYKTIINKRLFAYEQVEALIAMLKTSIADEDQRVYHILFFNAGESDSFQTIFRVSSQSLWLSDEIIAEAIDLNRIIYSMPDSREMIIERAKELYPQIAELRTRLEKQVSIDFVSLHDIKAFLKSKKPVDSYGQLPSRN